MKLNVAKQKKRCKPEVCGELFGKLVVAKTIIPRLLEALTMNQRLQGSSRQSIATATSVRIAYGLRAVPSGLEEMTTFVQPRRSSFYWNVSGRCKGSRRFIKELCICENSVKYLA